MNLAPDVLVLFLKLLASFNTLPIGTIFPNISFTCTWRNGSTCRSKAGGTEFDSWPRWLESVDTQTFSIIEARQKATKYFKAIY